MGALFTAVGWSAAAVGPVARVRNAARTAAFMRMRAAEPFVLREVGPVMLEKSLPA